jgi:hypothetical protein
VAGVAVPAVGGFFGEAVCVAREMVATQVPPARIAGAGGPGSGRAVTGGRRRA